MISKSTPSATHPALFAKGQNAIKSPLRTGLTSLHRNQRDRRDGIERGASDRPITALLPIMVVVLAAFLIIGLALPVLPLHVHHGLGLSIFVVGLVTGSQFAASLISRVWSGHYADRRGAKRAVVSGLLAAVTAGLFYLVSLLFVGTPWVSVAILLAGRALLGGAESGAKVALACVFVEAAGLALIWLASDYTLAASGAALTGFGYSLVYPGLGVEAVRRAPAQSRGLAMGAYTVFLDVALGFGSPMLGLLAGWAGLGSVFLGAALSVLGTAVLALQLLAATPPGKEQS